MKISIDEAFCQGHGRCYELAPDLIQDDDRGHARVTTAEVPSAQEGAARAASQSCPERAIALSE